MPLKWPETNYQSCSVKLSSRLLEEFGLQWRFSTIYDQGLQTYCAQRQYNANIENQNSIPIYTDRYQAPTRENNSVRATFRNLKCVNIPA